MYCKQCGTEIDSAYCPVCGMDARGQSGNVTTVINVPRPPSRGSAWAAGFLSLICPGLGQVYNGQLLKGVVVATLFWIGLACLIIPGLIVWVYATIDASETSSGDGGF